jgi:hypothetical protein
MSTLYAKGNAIYPDTSLDLSASVGYLVTLTGGVAAVNTSATVPAKAVVLDARTRVVDLNNATTTTYDNALGILGGLAAPCRGKISASATPLNFGDALIQAADGTLTNDPGPGTARVVVGILTDKNGALAGDLAEVTFIAPQIRS